MLKDFRHAWRMMRHAPGFTAVALLTLALGIGANAAIFNLANALILRRLPVAHPEQLALLTDPASGGTYVGTDSGDRGLLAYSEYSALRDHATGFFGVLASASDLQRQDIAWASRSGAPASLEPAYTQLVSANFFSVLGAAAWRGRVFTGQEAAFPRRAPVAVMAYSYWQHRFGGSPNVLGREFTVNGHAFTVIGVMPRGFCGDMEAYSADLWIPLGMQAADLPGLDRLHDGPGVSRVMWLEVLGRRRPGVTLAQAGAAANLVFHRVVEQQAAATVDAGTRKSVLRQRLKVSDGAAGVSVVRGQFSRPIWSLFVLVGLILLLAVVNLTSLLLARAAGRQKEMGVRLALGASRGRILRQLLTESVLLALVGGALGAYLAVWGDRLLMNMVLPPSLGISLDLAPDWRVGLFLAALCLAAGILLGLAPALQTSRTDVNRALQTEGRGGARGGLKLGRLLVVGQVAISIVLVLGAALLVRSLRTLERAPLGFQPDHLAEFDLDLAPAHYQGAAATALLQRFLEQARAVPGVAGAALSDNGLFEDRYCFRGIAISGVGAPPGGNIGVECQSVSGGYFATAGVPILLGRAISQRDQSGAAVNVVISATMRKRYFAGVNPIGRQIRDLYPGDKGVVFTIVGVAGDSKIHKVVETVRVVIYLPLFNSFPGSHERSHAIVLVREAGTGGAVGASLKRLLRNLDASLPPPEIQSVGDLIAGTLVIQALMARLSSFFGALALLLAAIGLYGVLAYAVAQRTTEMGVRMALGADRGAILRLVLGEAAVMLAAGLAIGVPLALAAARLAASSLGLYQVSPFDPVALAVACLLLAAVALVAAWLPARRASRIGPAACLRG
ncbi:MAG: ABC transporter permease [Terriglobales bacterium]